MVSQLYLAIMSASVTLLGLYGLTISLMLRHAEERGLLTIFDKLYRNCGLLAAKGAGALIGAVVSSGVFYIIEELQPIELGKISVGEVACFITFLVGLFRVILSITNMAEIFIEKAYANENNL